MKKQYNPKPKRDNRPYWQRGGYPPYRQLTPKDCNFLELPELGIDDPYGEIINTYKKADMSMWWRICLSGEQEFERPTFIRNYCEV